MLPSSFGMRMASGSKTSARFSPLALVPLSVAILVGALVLPRATPPREVPLPAADARALDQRISEDRARAERARAIPLDANVRALGSAVRAFHAAEAEDSDLTALAYDRDRIRALAPIALAVGGVEGILTLRALQLEEFLATVAHFEVTGQRTRELDEVTGSFIRSEMRVGWCRDRSGAKVSWPPDGRPKIVLEDDASRRAAFKLTWNAEVGMESRPELALALDETRALYAFYLLHPHAPENQVAALDAARRGAADASTCERIDGGERLAAAAWALKKMKELAAKDPAYPFAFARGILLYHQQQYDSSASAFHEWLDAHPDGRYALRARNYEIAARSLADAL